MILRDEKYFMYKKKLIYKQVAGIIGVFDIILLSRIKGLGILCARFAVLRQKRL
jgi:hypothetical protein